MTKHLPEETRMELFRMLVNIQDGGSSVDDSRRLIAEQFVTAVEDVRSIEREGIMKQWPPLSRNPD